MEILENYLILFLEIFGCLGRIDSGCLGGSLTPIQKPNQHRMEINQCLMLSREDVGGLLKSYWSFMLLPICQVFSALQIL